MRYFLIYFSLDTLTKILAVVIAPNNELFRLVYNPNMALGIATSDLWKFIVPALCFPIPYLLVKKAQIKSPHLIGLMYAGMVGNYLGRFLEQGVVDFINCQIFVCNLADIYQWVAVIGTVYLYEKNYIAQQEKSKV